MKDVSLRRILLVFLVAFIGISAMNAAEPEVRNLSVRGLRIGGNTTLVIDGDSFGKSPSLLLPFPAKVALKPGATDKQATFDVAVGEDVAPGYYHLRVASESGVSLPNIVTVDRLPQRPLVPVADQLPVALHGTLSGSTIAETSFSGKAGQKITIEVEAHRLGSKFRPILHLYSPKRLQIQWAWGIPALHGDARIETTLPEDGVYRVTLHDGEYQAQPGIYRLRIGQWSYVDQVFPPVVAKDTASVERIGSDSGTLAVPTTRNGRWTVLPWPKDGNWSGLRPYVETATRTEVMKQSAAGKVQDLPAGSVGVCSRLNLPFAEDRYRVPVVAGSKVRFEVFAERLRSPIDTALVIRNEMGADLARAEDSPGTLDPILEYTVPEKMTAIQLAVVDSQGKGGPHGNYRLTIDTVPVTSTRNDFELFTPARRVSLPVDGATLIPVWVDRRGYSGAIELSSTGLPAGLKLDGMTIPVGAEGTLVSVKGSAAPVQPAVATLQSRASDGREHTVMQKEHPMIQLQPWMAAELAVGTVAGKGKEFQVEWKDPKPSDLIVPGRRWAPFVKCARTGVTGPVRLTLLTSQLPPVLNNQPDLPKTIRLDKATEIAPASNESEVGILIPVELPGEMYDVAIQAELLSADKRTVVATADTAVRRLPTRLPMSLTLSSPSRMDVKLDPKKGAAVEIAGKIDRLEGTTGEVQITLTGLPPGITVAPLNVKADAKDFQLKLNLPVTTQPGEIKGLKLTSSIVPDPKQPNQRVRAKDVELTLNVNVTK
jgi:hypothetical protein